MALTARFHADFSSFQDACAKAVVQLRGLETNADKVGPALTRMANSLSGTKIIQDATLAAEAVNRIGGVSKLTERELARVGATATEAVAKMKALGVEVPPGIQKIADAVKAVEAPTAGLSTTMVALGSFIGTMAANAVTALGRLAVDGVQRVVSGIGDMVLAGAGVADVEQNFQRLTSQAGLLGDTLLGTLRAGTHNTITDFELMKTVNQDLAAGLVLTGAQFSTLSQGAFALAQATGGDVKSALDTMNDAMLTGRTRSLALLTGKIDLEAAEMAYAASLGTTRAALTDTEQLEAARIAILDGVTAATKRLGVQTDGLDEKVAQAQVTWANFREDLGKTIAQSSVLEAGMASLQGALTGAFGGSQQALVVGLAKKFDEAAIAVIGMAEAGVSAVGFLGHEFIAVKVVIGDVAQVVSGVALAFKYLSKAAAEALNFTTPWKAFEGDVRRIDAEIGTLLITMKQRGDQLQKDSASHETWSATSQQMAAVLATVKARMVEASKATADGADASKDLTTHLGQQAEASGRTGTAARASAEATKDAAEASTRYAAEVAKLTTELSGDGAIAQAEKYMDALKGIGDVSKLTKEQQAEVNRVVEAAIAVYRRMGQQPPADIKRVAAATVDLTAKMQGLDRLTAAMDFEEPWMAAERAVKAYIDQVSFVADEVQRANALQIDTAPWEASEAAVTAYIVSLERAAADSARWNTSIATLAGSLAQLAQITGDSANSTVRWVSTVVGALDVANKSIATFQAGLGSFKAGDRTAGLASMAAGATGIASGLMQATDSASKLKATLGGAAYGAKIGAVAGPYGAAIGAGVGALVGLVRSIGKEARQVNDLRDAFVSASGGLDALNKTAHGAGLTLNALLKADTVKEYEAAVTSLQTTIGKVAKENERLAAETLAFMDALPGTLDLIASSGALVTAEFSGVLGQLDAMGAATAEINTFVTGQLKGAVGGINAFVTNAAVTSQASADAMIRALMGSFGELTLRGMSARDAIAMMGPTVDKLSDNLSHAGITGSVAWDSIRSMADLARDSITGPMLDAIHGASDALTGLHNAGILDQGMFVGLSSQVADTFATMVSGGKDASAALALVAPDIQKIWQLQEDFGFTVDDSTQRLIDQATEAGLVGEAHRSAQEQAVVAMQAAADAMVHVGEILERVFGTAAVEGEDFATRVNTAIGTIPRDIQIRVQGVYSGPSGMPGSSSVPAGMPEVGPVIPMAAGGSGTVTQPTLFLAGEQGREDFAFSGAGKIFAGGGGADNTAVVQELKGLREAYLRTQDKQERLLTLLPTMVATEVRDRLQLGARRR